jgi:hypothetical protein
MIKIALGATAVDDQPIHGLAGLDLSAIKKTVSRTHLPVFSV